MNADDADLDLRHPRSSAAAPTIASLSQEHPLVD